MPMESDLHSLPLREVHRQHGARMVAFAGFEMPLCYSDGILKEHLHTRASASLFDVSHMGQLLLRPQFGGNYTQVALALESLLPADLAALPDGRQRYSFLTTSDGGIRDDLIVARLNSALLLVVNGATKYQDERHLREQLTPRCQVELRTDRALLALQGPRAAEVLRNAAPAVTSMRFMDIAELSLHGFECWVMRSGYTGEDGFEISVSRDVAPALAERLLADPAVRLAGLGARDSLRLEAGLCLYGSDIGLESTPIEAGLAWAIPAARRPGGARAGGFPGAEPIFRQLQSGAARRRVGLRSERRPVRGNAPLYPDESTEQTIGHVTSGGFGPSINAPVAMGYVESTHAVPGARLFAQVGNTRVLVAVTALPFVPHRYQRTATNLSGVP